MAGTIRGDGLFRAERALAALLEDPQRLDRARERFSESPPSYRSRHSHNSTRSQSPNLPSEEQRRRDERKWQLKTEHRASLPYYQFQAQTSEEMTQVWKSDPRTSWQSHMPVGGSLEKNACQAIKNRWLEQGIWKDEWNNDNEPGGRWKHEELLESESESETDSEAEDKAPLFSFPKMAGPKPRRPKSDDEIRRIAERRAVREREREASRPFYQFFHQLSKERERIQDKLRADGVVLDSADINTRPFEEVKNTWTKRGIWNQKWGILPRMSWKHEQPIEEMLAEEMGDDRALVQANLHEGDRNGEPPLRRIFGSPSPAESNHNRAADVLSMSQQELSAAVELGGLQNGYASHLSSAPNSGRRKESRHDPHTAAAQRRRGDRASFHEDRQGPIARMSLTRVPPSRVSKTSSKTGPGSRRPNPSVEFPSNAQPPLPRLDTKPPRRSIRLQGREPSEAADLAGIPSPDLLDGASQPRGP